MTQEQVEAVAQFLRERLQSSKRLNPWGSLPMSTKRKWIKLAEEALKAAENA